MPSVCWVVLALVIVLGHERNTDQLRPLESLADLLARTDNVAVQKDILRGMAEALAGRRSVKAPLQWRRVQSKLATSTDVEIRERVQALSLLFGDAGVLNAIQQLALDKKAETKARQRALDAMLDRGVPELFMVLKQLLDDEQLRRSAIRGLARLNDPRTPALLLERYPQWSTEHKVEAINTLTSQRGYALPLLDAVEAKRIPRSDISALHARQLLALNDSRVSDRLTSVWGSIRPTAKDREQLIIRYRSLVNAEALKKADRSEGRLLWNRSCASCHLLFGEGGKIGPDLTGSQRSNPDYLLHKLLDPNAAVPRDYQVSRIVTTAGRVLTGVVTQEMEKNIVLQTPTEQLRILKSDIETLERTTTSLMPEGLLQMLSDDEVRNLISYIAGSGQVNPPPGRK